MLRLSGHSYVFVGLWLLLIGASHAEILYQGRFNTEVKGVFLPVQVQGQEYLFLLDSGSTYSVLDTSLRHFLGEPLTLPKIEALLDQRFEVFSTEMPRGSADLPYFEPIPMHLGKLDLASSGLYAVADLQSLWLVSGIRFHGIIGASFMRQFSWELDFDVGELVVRSDSAGFSRSGPSVEVPMLMSPRGVPVVRAEVGSFRVACDIDSGGGGSGRVAAALFNQLRAAGHVKSTGGVTTATAGGTHDAILFRLDRLSLGGQAYESLVFDVSRQTALGYDFLARHNLVLDFPGNRLLLRNRAGWQRRDEVDKSGLKIGADQRGLFVFDSAVDSPAFDAGIRRGDRVISVNGTPVDAAKVFLVRRALSGEEGTGISITTVRNNKVSTPSFSLGADRMP